MKTFTALLACLVCLIGTAPAGATIHTGRAEFEPPAERRTIGEVPPPCAGVGAGPSPSPCELPLQETPKAITVAYDDVAGSLTVAVEVFDPAYWGEAFPETEFALGGTCAGDELKGDFAGGEIDVDERSLVARGNPSGSVTLAGYDGSVGARASFSGPVLTFVWQDPSFAHRNWRCIEFGSSGVNPIAPYVQGENVDIQGQTIALGGWPMLTAKRGSVALIRTLTAVANAHHTIGFSSRKMRLGDVKVTNNGWAVGTPIAKNPRFQGNGVIIFRLASGRWRVDTAGSAFPRSNVPAAVLSALGL
jgi:hypothetical protein